MTPSKGTARRTIRIADDLWDDAQAEAERRGVTVSDVIRSALEWYTTHPDHPDYHEPWRP